MQIVIDIPEEMYQKIKETSMVISGRRSGRTIDYTLFNAVNKGIPLPKGHGDLIDADAVMREMSAVSSRPIKSQMYIIKLAPIIIEADKEE